MNRHTLIGDPLRPGFYLDVTNRRTRRRLFCPTFCGPWTVGGYGLRLWHESGAEQLVETAGDPSRYEEVVFGGLGKPTLRLDTVLAGGRASRCCGARVRLKDDELANLVHGRDATPDREDSVGAVSVSLHARDDRLVTRNGRRLRLGGHAVRDFVRRGREYVPSVAISVIEGLTAMAVAARGRIAGRLGVRFRRRMLGVVG